MSDIYIDDQDLSKVVYNGTWAKGGTSREYAGTVASSTTVGDSFTVTFTGTSIAVYGTFDSTSGGVITTYSVDGAPGTNATAQAGLGDTIRQQFWRSERLSLAEHQLHVTMTKVNFDPEPGEGTVWFDYFLVTDPTITSTGLTPASTSPPIINSQKSKPIGAIVGGVIGGFSLMLVAIFVFICYRRRKSSRALIPGNTLPQIPGSRYTSVNPFMLGNGGRPENPTVELDHMPIASRKSVANGRPTSPIANLNGSVHTDVPLPASGKHAARNAHGQTDDSLTSGTNTSRSPAQDSDNPQPREEGSDARQPSNTQIPEASAELPPVYSAV